MLLFVVRFVTTTLFLICSDSPLCGKDKNEANRMFTLTACDTVHVHVIHVATSIVCTCMYMYMYVQLLRSTPTTNTHVYMLYRTFSHWQRMYVVTFCTCVVHAVWYLRSPTLQHNSVRSRLLAVDGNTIDCMFVDRRGSPDITAKGNKLVICCEGNAAFYELGMMEIPLTCECISMVKYFIG